MFNTTVKSDEDVIKYGKEILKKGTISHHFTWWRWSDIC